MGVLVARLKFVRESQNRVLKRNVMRCVLKNSQVLNLDQKFNPKTEMLSSAAVSRFEVADSHRFTRSHDLVSELKANLNEIADLQKRIGFVMTDVRKTLKFRQ